jgi:hypothetical protein
MKTAEIVFYDYECTNVNLIQISALNNLTKLPRATETLCDVNLYIQTRSSKIQFEQLFHILS